jgi:tRNA threonylcarbamoyladenosine biosynthesis protein TsaB
MALILLIDTAGEQGIVALSADGIVVAQHLLPEARRQAAVLQPVIAEVVAAAGRQISDLEAVSVVAGPGSYTGLRVGLAAAKGLCFALDIPLLMPDRLLLLALSGNTEIGEEPVWVFLPARVGEWFAGCYSGSTVIISARHWEEDSLKKVVFESGTKRIYSTADVIEAEFLVSFKTQGIPLMPVEPNVAVFSKESEYRYVNGIIENVALSVPLYLKSAFLTSQKVKTS